MTTLTSALIALYAILAGFYMLMFYDMQIKIKSLHVAVRSLETHFEVEARPLVVQKYGSIYVNGEGTYL